MERSDELNEVVGVLKQQLWRQDEDISRLKAEAETQARMYGEELRMLDDENKTAEAEAAHENQMLRLDLTRLREETRACRHAKRQSAELNRARWEAEERLHEHEAHEDERKQEMQRKMVDLQARLERQYRVQLKGLRREYRAEALVGVGEEARVALEEWTALRNETEDQRNVINAGLRRYGGLRLKLGEKARDLELQRDANGMQSAKAIMYRRQLAQLGETAERAQEDAAAAGRQRVEATEALQAEVAEQKSRADELAEAYALERREAVHWRRQALLYMQPVHQQQEAAARAVSAAEGGGDGGDGGGGQSGDPLPEEAAEPAAESAARWPAEAAESSARYEHDLDAIWKAPADAPLGGFAAGGGRSSGAFRLSTTPATPGKPAAPSPAHPAVRPATAAPTVGGGGARCRGFGSGGASYSGCAGSTTTGGGGGGGGVSRGGCGGRGGGGRLGSGLGGGLDGGGELFDTPPEWRRSLARASSVPAIRHGTAAVAWRPPPAAAATAAVGMAAVGGGCRPASALRTAHSGGAKLGGGSGRRPASAAGLTMRSSSRPGSAASLPGSHACDPGFSLLQPPPAAGIGMFPRTASELAARRARPASAQPRTCGGGWRLKGGGSSAQSRVARERYFVPPPSRVVTHQEGTTLFFDVPRARR